MSRSALPLFMHPPKPLSLSGLRVVLDNRGWPRAALVEGPASDDGGRLALYVAAEFENANDVPLDKAAIEWLHLAKARHDLERGGCSDLSGTARFGANPPDFRLLDGNDVSVELAQLTTSDRRHALSLLKAVRHAILRSEPARFERLRRRLVFIGFDDQRGLPPRTNDTAAVERVLARLDGVAPGPEPTDLPTALAKHGFIVTVVNQRLGEGTAACFPLPTLPGSRLASERGFEIAAAMTVTIRVKDTEQELARLVEQHDRESNEILLVSAGAPGRSDGLCLVSEEVSVEPWIAKTMRWPRPRHLKRVLLHRWSYGDVYELYPNYRLLSPRSVDDAGGATVVPVGQTPSWAWTTSCPCGSGSLFSRCHGRPSKSAG